MEARISTRLSGEIVISIELASKKIVKYKVAQIRGAGGSSRYFPSKVELADWFPIEPAFSVTIHKAQVSNPFVFCSYFFHHSYVSVHSSIGLVPVSYTHLTLPTKA